MADSTPNPFTSQFTEMFDRLDGYTAEMKKMQDANMDRARTVYDEMLKLGYVQFDYMVSLSREWQNLALDTVKNARGFMKAA